MNVREIEAKARLLFDEYGPDALNMAARRADAFAGRADAEAVGWRAVQTRTAQLVRQSMAAEVAETEMEIRRAGDGFRWGRIVRRIFGARKTA